MRLYGRVWFDFVNPQVWHLYRFVRAFARAGNTAELDWVPLFSGSEAEAMSVYIGLTSPVERGTYLHAMLGLVHMEAADPNDHDTVVRAMSAAGISGEPPTVNAPALDALASAAGELGVEATPTLYQHGPVLHVVLSGAALTGRVDLTAQTIMAVLNDDGIWSLTKPPVT
jgi:hypothetical protein